MINPNICDICVDIILIYFTIKKIYTTHFNAHLRDTHTPIKSSNYRKFIYKTDDSSKFDSKDIFLLAVICNNNNNKSLPSSINKLA